MMMRILKTLGVGLLAALALSAVMASASSAKAVLSTNAPGPTVTIDGISIPGSITGVERNKHDFTTVAGIVRCNTAEFMGDTTNGAEEIALTPTYSSCTLAGLGATVNMNGCTYRFHSGETTGAVGEPVTLKVDVVCPAGASIVVKATGSTCEVKVGAQTGLSGITLHNNTFEPTPDKVKYMDVTATIDVPSIKYTIVNGSKCPNAPASGEYNTGKYEGLATLWATSGGTHYDLTAT